MFHPQIKSNADLDNIIKNVRINVTLFRDQFIKDNGRIKEDIKKNKENISVKLISILKNIYADIDKLRYYSNPQNIILIDIIINSLKIAEQNLNKYNYERLGYTPTLLLTYGIIINISTHLNWFGELYNKNHENNHKNSILQNFEKLNNKKI